MVLTKHVTRLTVSFMETLSVSYETPVFRLKTTITQFRMAIAGDAGEKTLII